MGNFGTVDFKGKTYQLTSDADFTQFQDFSFNEAEDGEEFEFEMAADARDDEGNQYKVYWVFTDIKGAQKELDSFDYDEASKIERIEE